MQAEKKNQVYINYNRHLPFITKAVMQEYNLSAAYGKNFNLQVNATTMCTRYCLSHRRVNAFELARAFDLLIDEAFCLEFPKRQNDYMKVKEIQKNEMRQTLQRACIIADRRK